jgi:anaerobic magnesium-protoporphyrin IX monomethyl ester cyclase
MARILLAHSYFYKFDLKQWKAGMLYPPIGTLYAAALMQKCGHTVYLFDSNLSDSPDEIEDELTNYKHNYLILYDDCFNWLTKMCLINMREAAFRMIELGKKNGCKVVVSSSDSTDHYDEYLNKGADFVIIGEGEYTLRELIMKLENNESNYREIDGIAFIENNNIVKTKERNKITELDMLPMPAWDLIDIDRYREIWKKSSQPFTLNIVATRGCPYHCSWCAKPVYGFSYNSRSPGKVLEEIEFLIHRFGVTNFWMCDDIFGLQSDWLRKFNDGIKEKQLEFSFIIQSRADLLLKPGTIDIYAESGLREVWIGAESGSQKILDAMNKGITIDQIHKVTQQIKSKNIRISFFLQLGYLGETRDDIDKTRKMLKDLMPDNIGVSVAYPLPGTKFYEGVKSDLKAKSNWVDSDDLAMMFRGTYQGSYYKKMHRFIHKEFRTMQALKFLKDFLFRDVKLDKHKVRAIFLMPYYFLSSLIYLIQIKILEWKKT